MKRIVTYFFPKEQKEQILLTFVSEIIKINETHRYINFGGCGVFAMMLYDKLKALGFNPEIAVMVFSKAAFEDSQNMYLEHGLHFYWNRRTEGFPHIILKVDGFYIDSSGAYEDWRDMGYNIDELYIGADVGFIRECSQQTFLWNDMFDRRDIPKIEERVNYAFDKVVNINSDIIMNP